MQRFYSKTTQTTYLPGIHSVVPDDAVEISEGLYLSVIGNPAEGKVRVHDDHGLPYLIDAPEVMLDPVTVERAWRDGELSSVIWLRERHRDQAELSEQTTLTADQFGELLAFMQALRDWPQSPNFPDNKHRPATPAWIADQPK